MGRMGLGRTVADAEAEGSGGDEDMAGRGLLALGVGVGEEIVVPLVVAATAAGVDSRLLPASDRAARPEVMPEFRFVSDTRTAERNMLPTPDCCCCCDEMIRVLSSVTGFASGLLVRSALSFALMAIEAEVAAAMADVSSSH